MRLHDYIRANARIPFRLGQHDCATFATGWIEAATGRDITHGLKGRYTTYKGGLQHVRKLGHTDHVALIAAHMPERTSTADARIGDIVVLPGEGGAALGICAGDHVQVLTEAGLAPVSMVHALRVFEVI